jgi:hypothetical protein
MATVTVQKRIPLGGVPNPCTDPSHDLCFVCCNHEGYKHRVIDAWPGAINPQKIIVQCENCGANGNITGEEIDAYAS